MAGTVVEPSQLQSAAPRDERSRKPLVLLLVAVLVALAVVAALAYRAAVRTEREEAFRSLYQAEARKLGDQLAQQSQLPPARRSLTAIEDAVDLTAPGVYRRAALDFAVGSADVSGDRLWAVLDSASWTADDPWWVGETYQRVSVLIHYRSTTVDSSNTVEVGSCVVEAVGVDWAGEPCTIDQLREFGLV